MLKSSIYYLLLFYFIVAVYAKDSNYSGNTYENHFVMQCIN
jgi:hypothetical protein